MFGRHMSELWGKVHFGLTFVGVYAIFTPMHFLGMAGNPRRYAELTAFDFLEPLGQIHLFVSIAAFITITAQLIFIVNLFWCMFKGKKAEDNPWQATTLEWEIPSPPPHDNFAGKLPVVYQGPYEYSVPGEAQDYTMQTAQKTPAS
jgi:cytochrome c oxidase subunit 1